MLTKPAEYVLDMFPVLLKECGKNLNIIKIDIYVNIQTVSENVID